MAPRSKTDAPTLVLLDNFVTMDPDSRTASFPKGAPIDQLPEYARALVEGNPILVGPAPDEDGPEAA